MNGAKSSACIELSSTLMRQYLNPVRRNLPASTPRKADRALVKKAIKLFEGEVGVAKIEVA